MSFVEWVSLLALLVVGTAGAISGAALLAGRHPVGLPIARGRRERLLLALLYLSGGAVALLAAILWLISPPP